jgi:hypothetical protein
MSSLNKNPTIKVLAADLKLKPSETPVASILDYCERQVRKCHRQLKNPHFAPVENSPG